MSDQAVSMPTPALWCPIPPAIHPEADRLEENTIAWMKEFGYITSSEEEQAARKIGFGTLAALVYPHGSVEVAAFGADMMTWLFLTDDEYVERSSQRGDLLPHAGHMLRCLQILRDLDVPDDLTPDERRHAVALRDLRQRLPALADAEHIQRLIDGIAEYFAAAAAEAIFRSNGRMPTVAEYTTLRESSIAMRTCCFVLSELMCGDPLPGDVWAWPDVQRASRCASRVVAWANDLLSGLRELSWPGAINLISVLAHEHGCSHREALDIAVRMHTAETKCFMDLSEQIRQSGREPRLDLYITGLGAWIRGNQDWSLLTGRYHVESPDTEAQQPHAFGE